MKKVLLVSNQRPNRDGVGNPIMLRMQRALAESERIEKVEFQPFENSIRSFLDIRRKAKQFDIVHVHFGGLYALLIRFFLIGTGKKTFITFHGTDIHAKQLKSTKSRRRRLKIRLNQLASFVSIMLYDRSGMVAKEMMQYVPKRIQERYAKRIFLQSLGVDYNVFAPIPVDEAQRRLQIAPGHYALFSDVANTPIKRRDIATKIIKSLGDEYRMLIMCGVLPDEVPVYINASDFVLLTSDEEGSPNIIREALTLNKPVFSVDVGDARMQLKDLKNSAIISRDPDEAAGMICQMMKKEYTDETRSMLQGQLDFRMINEHIIDLYEQS